MRSREKGRFNPDGAHFTGSTSILAQTFLENQTAQLHFLHLLKSGLVPVCLLERTFGFRVWNKCGHHTITQGADGLSPSFLARSQEGFTQTRRSSSYPYRLEGSVGGIRGRVPGKFSFTQLFTHPELKVQNRLHLAVSELDGRHQQLLVHLFGSGFHHQNRVFGSSYHDVEVTSSQLGQGGVQDVLAIHHTHPHGGARAVPGDVRKHQGARGGDGSQYVWGVVLVAREHGQNHLGFLTKAFGKQRANLTVCDAGAQNSLFTGPTLTALEATGNLAHRVVALFKFHGQRQKIQARGFLQTLSSGENHGVAVA